MATPDKQKDFVEPDEVVESNAVADLLFNSTEESERDYLLDRLSQDIQLAAILDKVLVHASEFSGSGEVEGGTEGATDSIPARLDAGEFVIPAAAVEVIGARRLTQMVQEALAQVEGNVNAPSLTEEPLTQEAPAGPSTPAPDSLLERGPATPTGPGPVTDTI